MKWVTNKQQIAFPVRLGMAEVMIDGKRSYYFSVDSVTGEVFNLGRAGRELHEDVR